MSHRRLRLETIKVTLIVVFHTPSSSLWIAERAFYQQMKHYLFALSTKTKRRKTPTDHNKCSHRGLACA